MGVSVKSLLLTNDASIRTRAYANAALLHCLIDSFVMTSVSVSSENKEVDFMMSSASIRNTEKHIIQNELDSLSSSTRLNWLHLKKIKKNNLYRITYIFFLLKYFGTYNVSGSRDKDDDDDDDDIVMMLIKCMESGAPYM